MVGLTSRVTVIAASISLTAILSAPNVEGIAIPLSTTIRSQEFGHQAVVRERSPVLDLPRANGDASEGQDEEKNKRFEKGELPSRSEDLSIHTSSKLLGLVSTGGTKISIGKRSTEQRFFHTRRGNRPQPGLHHRSSSSKGNPFVNPVKSRDEGDHPPGHVELMDLLTKNDYGSLYIEPSTGDIDASKDKATIWYRISSICPSGSGFDSCVSLAMFDTSDKNRCITYSSSADTKSAGLHGDYCWDQAMAKEEAAVGRSQIFGYKPGSGRIVPITGSASGQSSTTRPVERRQEDGEAQRGEEVAMFFTQLEQTPGVKSNINPSDSLSSSATTEPTATAIPTSADYSSTAIASDTSTATATSTETMTLTVTVTAESEPTTSAVEDSSTTSATGASSATQSSVPLKVKVFGDDNSSSATDSVSSTPVAARTTGPPTSNTTPTGSVDGDVVASSIAAEDSSSIVSTPTPTAAARR